jgi:hypothetical protein
MAIDFRIGTKILKSLQAHLAPATSINPYPYIGVVKNNLDPTRCGRVQVYIPELGGNPDDQANWRTVSYASPFMGYTSTEINSTDTVDTKEAFQDVSHTYGMWMVPPDVGVEVICIFVAGDPMRGYWIACVNSNLSRYMLPGLASSNNVNSTNASADAQKSYTIGNVVPVVEFNENINTNTTNSNFYNAPKPIHETQYAVLKNQGLDRDDVRGTTTSSSQRETPSHVFGISTPGRPFTNDPADDPNYITKLNAGTITEDYYRVKSRKGGHTFIMDDGSVVGGDQLMRLRTAKGHQILMHDTEQTIYIGHSTGNSWVEMGPDGSINMYSLGGVNLRSENTINVHSDNNINLNAKNNLHIFAGNTIQIQSDTTKLHQSNLVSNVALTINNVTTLGINVLTDSVFLNDIGLWSAYVGVLNTTVTIAPSHEPWQRNYANTRIKAGVAQTNAGNASIGLSGVTVVVTTGPSTVTDSLTYDSTTGTLTFTPYILPLATPSIRGGVKYDNDTIIMSNEVVSVVKMYVTDAGTTQQANINSSGNTIVARDPAGNIYATNFVGIATTAQYADLAEKYLTDQPYPVGTVVCVGGPAETTASNFGDRALGVVSENPAYRMNDGLTNGTYIALKGRVPCRVMGDINKGDQLIAGDNGCAVNISTADKFIPYPFAIALNNYDNTSPGVIEVVVL